MKGLVLLFGSIVALVNVVTLFSRLRGVRNWKYVAYVGNATVFTYGLASYSQTGRMVWGLSVDTWVLCSFALANFYAITAYSYVMASGSKIVGQNNGSE